MGKINFSEKLKNIFGIYKQIDDNFFEELTDSLIEGDVGAKVAFEIEEILRNECKVRKINDISMIPNVLKDVISPFVHSCILEPELDKSNIYLVIGVNGVGKTTSIAKMASYYKYNYNTNIILAAADTFRAAAIDQLQIHGKNLGTRVIAHKHGGDPAAVVFDAGEAIKAQGGGIVFVDTAGRLHNKENLVRELQKIDRIADSKADVNTYKKILVLDSTTGQNGMRQAEVFHEAIGIDYIFLSKYDSTAKGGIAITLGKELGLPIMFLGVGEQYDNIKIFDTDEYLNKFIGIK